MTAEQFLQSVFARYRNAQSYRDRGQARLMFQANGQARSEVAPLSVWFDRNSLYVDAYDAHIRRTPTNLTAWITDPTTDNFDSQVVQTASQSERPTIHALLSDTVLRERIAAGLAGPPPQLEWLFAAEPMKRLFDGPFQIAFGKPVRLEDRDCVAVVVEAEDGIYRFAIDQRSGVIRQVQLPSLLAPTRFQPNSDASNSVRLILELTDATFEAPVAQPAQAVLPERPKYVSHFIPLPPERPSDLLDTRLIAFKIRDQSGRAILTHRGLQRDLTLILLASEQPADLAAAANLVQWTMVMPPNLRQRIDVAIVTNEAGFRQLPRELPLPIFIDSDRTVQNSVGMYAGSLAIVNRDARIVWVQKDVATDSLPRLGRIVGDLLTGVDVPARLTTQWQSDKATYESILNAEVSRPRQR